MLDFLFNRGIDRVPNGQICIIYHIEEILYYQSKIKIIALEDIVSIPPYSPAYNFLASIF